MGKQYVDLHIHSALSPCAEEEMTPHNIVNMSLLKGLKMIAVTDHNAIGNVQPALHAAQEKPLVVVPGIEITSQEEVHLLAYFKHYEALEAFYQAMETHLPARENRPDIFGRQYLFDLNDEVTGEDPRLLMNAVQLSFDRLVQLIREYEGVPVPAHVDRGSFSVYANMGFMPAGLPIQVVEVTQGYDKNASAHMRKELSSFRHLISSDAHNLGNILEQVFFIDLKDPTMEPLFEWFNQS